LARLRKKEHQRQHFRAAAFSFILILQTQNGGIYSHSREGNNQLMPKRKPARFSAAKAVKANARERVGQPKPARVVQDTPRTGRQAKHKEKMEDLLRGEQ
jgi:hypothetical protein